MSGPGFADEIKSGKPIVLTATDPVIDELFGTDSLKFDHTDDRLGVLMCGALKNVYAIFAGYLQLERGSSAWLNYIKAAAAEMMEILLANGADRKTVDLACGIPDLKLTCGYPSRNYEYGDRLRVNPDYLPEKTVEGVSTIKRIRQNEIVIPSGLQILPDILKLVIDKE
jgi:glycerol-3-phosphate dehydrogenase (NAD(P)+)